MSFRLCNLPKFAAAVMLLLPSCGTDSMFREIAANQQDIRQSTAAAAVDPHDITRLDWKQARDRLISHNESIRSSATRLEELKRERKNQWREWLPRPTFYVNLQDSFKELGNLTSDSINSSIYAPLVIPNPWTQTARAYQYALSEVQAEAYHELTRRRQIIALYRQFSEWERAGDRLASTASSNQLEEAVRIRLQARESTLMEEERLQMQRGQLSRMLNMPGTNITLLPKSRPAIDYSSKFRKFVPGKNYGTLATQLSAYELQAALLRKRGVDLQRWPTPNFSTTTPAIYDSNREDRQFFGDVEQISIFGSWNKTFDLTGRQAAEIRSAKDNVRFVRDNLNIRLDSEGREWRRLQQRYEHLLQQRNLLQSRLRNITRTQNRVGSVRQDLDDARKLMTDLQNIERRKEHLDLELWLWDDTAW
jgi:hypothetical protein